MSVDYRWKWLRGQGLTAKFNNGTTAHDVTYQPCILDSNLLEVPTQGAELIGVAVPDAAASDTKVPIIISNDIFEVQLASAQDPGLGDEVTIEEDGSVSERAAGDSICGVIVDYDPASGGIAHIRANFEALERVVVTDIGTGEVGTTQLAADAVTKAKIADDQVDSEHIVDKSIDTAHIDDAQVTADKLAGAVAGDGLAGGAGTALSVGVDDSSIEIDTDKLRVKAGGVTDAMLATDVKVGSLAALDTTAKGNVVAAINEAEGTATAAYVKPVGDIPKTDLATAVQTSLGKADTALQVVAATSVTDAMMATDTKIGSLAALDTTEKSNVVAAINEAEGTASAAYVKPGSDIPASDMAAAVQTSLGKADTALQAVGANDVDSDAYTDGSVDPIHLAATCTEKVVLTHIIPQGDGDITADPGDVLLGIASGAGTIVKAGFVTPERGIDDTDELSIMLDIEIGGVTIFTTKPKITEKAGGAASSFVAGDDIIVGVIDAAADDVVENDVIGLEWTLVRTTPDTEASGLTVFVEIEYKVGA